MPAYTKRGTEFSVNSASASLQNQSHVATFADGGFVVVWETTDTAADGSGGAIKAQRFDSAGNKAGAEFLVNSSFATTQSQPVVTSFADGSFAVAWTTDDPLQDGAGRAVKARLFGASGVAAGPEFLVNTATAGNQAEPSMATLANGNFVITWWEAWFGEVHGRIFTADGTPLGPDFRLNTNMEGTQNSSDVTGLAGGGFVVTWRSGNTADDGSGDSVKGQVFSATGAKVGGEFLVNTNKFGHQNDPSVAGLAGGGFVVAWMTSQADDGSGSALKMQLFSATGAKVGNELLVNSAGASSQEQPAVTALPDGGFMVAWMTADSAQDGDRQAVKAQVFSSAGARVGSEFLVNTQAYDSQWNPDIATLSDGRVIVTWTDSNAEGASNWGIKAQIFGPGDPPPPPPSNWAPVITSDGGGATALRWVAENATIGARVTAQDPDGQAVTYSIVGGADAALFTIDAQSGVVSFITKPNYEAPADSGGDNRYEIIVSASDGLASDTQALTIAIDDVDENVRFTSSNNIFRAENYTAAYMVTAVQPADPSATISYRIVEGADSALFAINAATGALNFKSQPDFEAPADSGLDNLYQVAIEATDGVTTATGWLAFHILDVNEAPVITSGGGGTSFALSIAENQIAVTTVSASDPEGIALVYAIAGGADSARFSIDAQTGALSFVAAPDFEARGDSDGNNIYAVIVSASDGGRSDSQTIFVTVTNQNESPVITSNGGGSAAVVAALENGLQATIVEATDPEGRAVAYAIIGGADASRFAINASTGVLSFLAAPNYEQPADLNGDNNYEVTVAASDGELSSSQSLQVQVRNVVEQVTITSYGGARATLGVNENSLAVGRVTAAGDGPITYEILSGPDAWRFFIDPNSGELQFASEPDYENPDDHNHDNVYEVVVRAGNGSTYAQQRFSVAVGNVNEGVRIIPPEKLVAAENQKAVTLVNAIDVEGDALTFAIAGGADAAFFEINATSGALSFITAPDYETPADSDGNNVYLVKVSASDGEFTATNTFLVRVGNRNESPSFVSSAGSDQVAVTIGENGGNVLGLLAVDPDGTTPQYAISGGADAALFELDPVTKALRFKALPDHEAPSDSDGDNVYEVVVSASDGALSDSQAISVTVTDVEEAVVFVSGGGGDQAAITVNENQADVLSLLAVDPDGSTPRYSIMGGADAAAFFIDPVTHTLRFHSLATADVRPDFETPRDSDGDNVYEVIVAATDGESFDYQTLLVSVANVYEGLGLAPSTTFSAQEGMKEVGAISARREEGLSIVYSITQGPDAFLFSIDPATGAISWIDAPDFEEPRDSDGDNVYLFEVTADDGVSSDSLYVSVTVGNVDEPIELLSYGGAAVVAVETPENSFATGIVVQARDDEDGAVTYAITGGADVESFEIDPVTGELSFMQPNAADYEDPTDVDSDRVHEVVVTASSSTSSVSQTFMISITDVNEAPYFYYLSSLTVNEGAQAITTLVGRDADRDVTTLAIVGGADAALFALDPVTNLLSFVQGRDFEAPLSAAGTNVYDVEIEVSDGRLTSRETLQVTIRNVNEAVTITSGGGGGGDTAAVTVPENGTAVTTIAASDVDGDALTYSITGGADGFRFTIDSRTGVLRFVQAPNFEAPADVGGNNVYDVVVSVTDGAFTDSQAIAVSVGNVNEPITIVSNGGGAGAGITVSENGRAVTTVVAIEEDGDPVRYAIVGGQDAAHFTIDAVTGQLAFVSLPDFEARSDYGADNIYDVVVSASDGVHTDTQVLAVRVADLNEAVEIVSNGGGLSASVTVAENGTAVTNVAAVDPDGRAVTYAIAGGADAALFTINAGTGALAFVAAPNFETPADAGANNVYDVVVSASDGSSSDTQALAVTVGNVNEPVTITSNGGGSSASVSRAENGTAVTVVAASDPDGGRVTFAIAGGADAARFTIDASTGALAFVAAPNFEAPADVGGNNVYDVVVSASDGSFVDTQAIAVTVQNLNEAPVITSSGGGSSAVLSVAENGLAVVTVAAADPDGTAVTYSIVGGADSARFTINAQTGLLQFVAAPDWELPTDSNGDNVYSVIVRAGDGQLADDQALTVTVANVRDGNNVTGTSGGDSISAASTSPALRTSNAEDLVFGRDGHDTILGMAGDDEIYGEAGNDTLTGGAGADRLYGGLGKDQFTYNDVSDSTAASPDMIMDFSRSQADKISLSAIDANSLVAANQAFTFIGTSAFSNVAGQLRYESGAGVTTVFGDVNGDGVADLVIQLSGPVPLTASDFVL